MTSVLLVGNFQKRRVGYSNALKMRPRWHGHRYVSTAAYRSANPREHTAIVNQMFQNLGTPGEIELTKIPIVVEIDVEKIMGQPASGITVRQTRDRAVNANLLRCPLARVLRQVTQCHAAAAADIDHTQRRTRQLADEVHKVAEPVMNAVVSGRAKIGNSQGVLQTFIKLRKQ